MAPVGESVSNSGQLLRVLLRHVRAPLVLGVVASVGAMGIAAAVPWWIGRTIDYLTADGADMQGVARYCAVLAFFVSASALLVLIQERCDTKVRVLASLRLLRCVHDQVIRLSGSAHRSVAGAVINLGLGDIRPIGAGIAALTRGVGGAAAVLAVTLILFTYSWQLCVLVLVGVLFLLRVNDRLLRPYRASQRTVRERMETLTGVGLDASSGLRVIKGLGAGAYFNARYRAASRHVLSAATAMAKSEGAVAANQALATGLLGTATVLLGATLARNGSMSVGGLVAAYGYVIFLMTPMRWLLATQQQWASGQVSVERITGYLSQQAVEDDPPHNTGDGTVTDLHSGWTAAAGQYTAVAAAAPLDWSEVADRLSGQYRHSANVKVIRADDYLFSGPIAHVLDASGKAPSAVVAEAVCTACLGDVIQALPSGPKHEITAGGINLSGGEQQRFRLARALVVKPAVLVLVDPTSALDSTTEVEVAQRLYTHRAGSTTVVLTNSPAHLSTADRVVFLAPDGAVLAFDTHAELMKRPDYRVMVERSEGLA